MTDGIEEDPARTAASRIRTASERRRARSSAKAKADLEEDVEELTASVNTHKFLTIIAFIVIFDAYIFQKFDTWASPICLTIIEAIGIFVLARHLEITEAIQITAKAMDLIGKRESDPGLSDLE